MKAMVLTGGPGSHPFATTSRLLADIAEAEGLETEVTDDIEGGLARLGDCRLLIVNALRWQMLGDSYADERATHAFRLSEPGRDAIRSLLARGGGVLASHTALICFDDWPEWADIVGARWVWGQSSHPPLGMANVQVDVGRHPVVANAKSNFQVVDEVYVDLEMRPDQTTLATAVISGRRHPLVWTRKYGKQGRVVGDALGHDERSITDETHALVLRQAVRWLAEAAPTSRREFFTRWRRT